MTDQTRSAPTLAPRTENALSKAASSDGRESLPDGPRGFGGCRSFSASLRRWPRLPAVPHFSAVLPNKSFPRHGVSVSRIRPGFYSRFRRGVAVVWEYYADQQ